MTLFPKVSGKNYSDNDERGSIWWVFAFIVETGAVTAKHKNIRIVPLVKVAFE